MGRWEPDARGRLAQAALTLYAEQGFERTTAAEIARLAGLTERSFYRNFADKREVLFYGAGMAQDRLASAIADAPASATPLEAVAAAIEAMCATFQENPERVRQRNAVISANAELAERELTKYAELTAAAVGALRARGTPGPIASLTAETGFAVFKVAFAHWISQPGQPNLPDIYRDTMTQLRYEMTAASPHHNYGLA